MFKNKTWWNGIIVGNKARLVSKAYNQEECIDFDEKIAPIARLKAIILITCICMFFEVLVFPNGC